jgi:hypothetical protein
MKSENVNIKLNRNKFFKYLLKTMKRTVDEQKMKLLFEDEVVKPEDNQNVSRWSPDKRTYVSAKVIPGYGTLVYMATSSNPEMEWEENGFARATDISGFPNLPNMDPIPIEL